MDKLFCFIVLGLVVLVPVAKNAPTEEEIKKCFQTMAAKSVLECAKSVFDYVDVLGWGDPCENRNGTCDETKCLFDTVGIARGGVINEDNALRVLTQVAVDKPVTKHMTERVQRYCLGQARYKIYFEDTDEHSCATLQLAICSYINSLIASVDTPLWKKTDECNEYSPEVKKCAKIIDEDFVELMKKKV